MKSHFRFNKQERSGIFYLLLILVLLQLGFYIYKAYVTKPENQLVPNLVEQQQLEVLKQLALKMDTLKLYPFNPNFISDYKGYILGMSLEEIDRLHTYRDKNKYVNTKEEFQSITKISDSLLAEISTYFKFPEWANKSSVPIVKKVRTSRTIDSSYTRQYSDLNSATEEELKTIYGIGDKLSKRIVKFRDRLGGFLVDDQLSDVYGLEPEVVKRVLERFKVVEVPEIQKINVNTATADELSKLVYLQYHVAQGIVDYRNLNGTINSLDELININDFPKHRIDRIALYLSLKK